MKSLLKSSLSFILALFAIFAVVYISCNKSDSPATTTVKCVTCLHGGICKNDTCHCPAAYEGSSCQTEARVKFQGTWKVTEKGTISDSVTYNVFTQVTSNFDLTQIILEEFPFQTSASVNSTINGDTITIPNQFISTFSATKQIVGKGYIYSDQIHGTNANIIMRYAVTDTLAKTVDDFGYFSASSRPSQWVKN